MKNDYIYGLMIGLCLGAVSGGAYVGSVTHDSVQKTLHFSVAEAKRMRKECEQRYEGKIKCQFYVLPEYLP